MFQRDRKCGFGLWLGLGVAMIACAAVAPRAGASAVEVQLAADGEAALPIVIAPEADASLEVAAEELADYLERISGAGFSVETGDGDGGIVLGVPGDFEDLPESVAEVSFGDGSFERDHYVIRSTDEGLYLLGATPLAARFAMWDLLYRFGHRQFFPTETWEIVPEREDLSVAMDVREEPDYYSRRAPRGAVRMDQRPWAQEGWENWQVRNRTKPSFRLSTGHVYSRVIRANEEAFDENPEYWGLVDGERTDSAQPNVAHPDVQQIFVDYALQTLRDEPDRDSVAMDPRDGNPWSESEESREIGRPSEQAVFIANKVAEAVVEEFGGDKYVGMYAYSHHSPPPRIDVHPNVIISLATSFIRGGYTFDEMIDGWSERANMLGIREYYGLTIWHWSLPGDGANAADTEYLQDTIARFHRRGARFMNAESNDAWGGYGLGYYLAARMMWDTAEAERMDELVTDFLEKSFGPAKEPMRDFYELIDGSAVDPYVPARSRPLNDDMVGRMYRLLAEARELASGDDAVRARIDDLILYTHFVELMRRFQDIRGPERQEAFDELLSFAWRIRGTMMAESVGLVRAINRRVRGDDNLEWGEGHSQNRPAYRHREGADEPHTDDEVARILEEGIESHELLDLDVTPWEDSGDLVPAGFEPDDRGAPSERMHRGDVHAVLHTDDGTLPRFTISAGHLYDNRGPVRWSLEDEDGDTIDSGEIQPDEQDHAFELSAPEPGVYRFSITNTGQGFGWSYEPRGAKLTLLAGVEHELRRNWYDRLYFYVPEGTETIHIAGTIREGRHSFYDASGEQIDPETISVKQDFTAVPVAEGQDGQVWMLTMRALRPNWRLLNVPGYVAFSPDELLLPRELVDER